MRIYIAGPYSQAAIDAAEALIALGHTPLTFWCAYTLEWSDVCDAVLRLPGPSVEADAEVARAKALSKPVWYSLADVPEGVKL